MNETQTRKWQKEGNPLIVQAIFVSWYGYEHFTLVDQ